MRRRPIGFSRTAVLALASATLLTFAEAAARPGQAAEAALWTLKVDPFSAYCEGCCAGNNLCCDLNAACRHPYPAEPLGGG